MKKFNLVLLAALFGSSFVACSPSTGDFDFETPDNSDTGNLTITAVRNDGTTVTFISVPDCETINDVDSWYENIYEITIGKSQNDLDFSRFRDSESLKNSIRSTFRNRYVIYRRSSGSDKLYELEITDTDVLLKATDTESESAR